ncbi:MAG: PCMD domain-containing protein, partial [Prevotellaceae bacterium]|nr:PCMD domain-containing protein [Prevotellaceae bacterium]
MMSAVPTARGQQLRVEKVPYGDMNHWIDREIKESFLIGGATKHVYAVGPTDTIVGNIPYVAQGGSPWATSNVLAHVAGIYKTNVSVFPERRDSGFCARMDTHMEKVKVLGIVDITVLAAGSLFLGEVHEPIQSTKNPQQMLSSGIPFTGRPVAIRFDYKVKLADSEHRIRATG